MHSYIPAHASKHEDHLEEISNQHCCDAYMMHHTKNTHTAGEYIFCTTKLHFVTWEGSATVCDPKDSTVTVTQQLLVSNKETSWKMWSFMVKTCPKLYIYCYHVHHYLCLCFNCQIWAQLPTQHCLPIVHQCWCAIRYISADGKGRSEIGIHVKGKCGRSSPLWDREPVQINAPVLHEMCHQMWHWCDSCGADMR